MSKDLLNVLETVANEKDIPEDFLFEAMEEALAIVTKKDIDENMEVEVSIDRDSGEILTDRIWTIVSEDEDLIDYSIELYEDVAKEKGYDVKVDDVIKERIESVSFGRIAATTAKQVLMKKIRTYERKRTSNIYRDKIGTIVFGEVKRISHEFLIIELANNVDAILEKKELINRERFKIGDKIKCCVIDVDYDDGVGKGILLSRSNSMMLKALFELEVPEAQEEIIQIVNVQREPGIRSKVTVKSNDKRIDPCGACVGVRGSRIRYITEEVNGERIDVILWDENIVQYAINSLSPVDAEDIIEVNLDEETNSMDIVVKQDSLSKAIGRNGINVRLASALIGWKIKVISDVQQEEKQLSIVENFAEILDIDYDLALVIIEEGIETLEDLAYLDEEELLEIEGFDEDIVKELQERAKTALLSEAFGSKPSQDLLDLEGITEDLANELARKNICTLEQLADLSVDELLELINISEENGAKIIMKARAPWFE